MHRKMLQSLAKSCIVLAISWKILDTSRIIYMVYVHVQRFNNDDLRILAVNNLQKVGKFLSNLYVIIMYSYHSHR